MCEHHRSVLVVSSGVHGACGVGREFQGGGGLLIFIFWWCGGVDVDSQVSWLEQDVALLNRIYPFSSLSLGRSIMAGFRVGKGKLAVNPPREWELGRGCTPPWQQVKAAWVRREACEC